MGQLNNYDHMKNNSWGKKVNDENVFKLYKEGFTDTEIGRILNVSNSCIFYWRKSRRLQTNRAHMKYTDLIYRMHSKGWSYSFMSEVFHKIGRPLSSSRVAEIAHKFLKLKPNDPYFQGSLSFTYKQEQILKGTALADGHVRPSSGGGKANLSFGHSLSQERYADWKAKELKCLKFKKSYKSHYDTRTCKIYKSVHYTSKAFKELLDIQKSLYSLSIKTPSVKFIETLDALAFATAYMDDGSYYTFCFNSFTENVNNLIRIRLKELDIHTTLQKGGIIYILESSRHKFRLLIKKFIHKDLLYKL